MSPRPSRCGHVGVGCVESLNLTQVFVPTRSETLAVFAAFKCRPTKILAASSQIDFFPLSPANIADVNRRVISVAVDRKAERISQSVSEHLRRVRINVAIEKRIVAQAFARDRIDSQDLSSKTIHIQRADVVDLNASKRATITACDIKGSVRAEFQFANRMTCFVGRNTVFDVATVAG